MYNAVNICSCVHTLGLAHRTIYHFIRKNMLRSKEILTIHYCRSRIIYLQFLFINNDNF